MKAPLAMFVELVARVRRDLYKGKPDKVWFSQQHMVKKALLYPATWLHQKGVEISAERYQEIMEMILQGVITHGNLSEVTYISRYLLHCVQQHMAKHGDNYYREGASVRNLLRIGMDAVQRARVGADSTVPILAEADKLLQIGKRQAKPKPPAPVEDQPTLF